MSTDLTNYLRGLQDKVNNNETLTEDEVSDFMDAGLEYEDSMTKLLNPKDFKLKIYSPQDGKIPVELYHKTEAVVCSNMDHSANTQDAIPFEIADRKFKLTITTWDRSFTEIDVGFFEVNSKTSQTISDSWMYIKDIEMIGTVFGGDKKEEVRDCSINWDEMHISVYNEGEELLVDIYNGIHYVDTVIVSASPTASYISESVELQDGKEYRIGLRTTDKWQNDISAGFCQINTYGRAISNTWEDLDDDAVVISGPGDAKDSTLGVIAPADRDIDKELQGLKLNVRIAPSATEKDGLEVTLFNHAHQVHHMKIQNKWEHANAIFEMYKNQYEFAMFSASRSDQVVGSATPLKDDFIVSVAIYNTEKNSADGRWHNISDVTYVDDAIIHGGEVFNNKKDADKLGKIGKWEFFRTLDKTEYFFKKATKVISGTTLQLAIEKFALSTANTAPLTIGQIKDKLGMGDVKFANDFSVSERQEAIRKELIKVSADTKETYDDYLARVAITAMRELSEGQRKKVQAKIELYSKDPESAIDEELGVAL